LVLAGSCFFEGFCGAGLGIGWAVFVGLADFVVVCVNFLGGVGGSLEGSGDFSLIKKFK